LDTFKTFHLKKIRGTLWEKLTVLGWNAPQVLFEPEEYATNSSQIRSRKEISNDHLIFWPRLFQFAVL
jgi:hypothetical protein